MLPAIEGAEGGSTKSQRHAGVSQTMPEPTVATGASSTGLKKPPWLWTKEEKLEYLEKQEQEELERLTKLRQPKPPAAPRRWGSSRNLRRPPTSMEQRAHKIYNAAEATPVPVPISDAATRFDSSLHLQTQHCELALSMVGDNPASVPESQRFDQLVQSLFWNRLVLDAPVERSAAAYPDPVWGIGLDQISTPRLSYATPRTSHRQSPRRCAGFSFGPNVRSELQSGGDATSQSLRRPMLPALRLHTQQPTEHVLLADSHYALGGFSEDRPMNWKGRSVEAPVKPKKPPWTLDTSIWRPRKHGPEPCDALDYYDTTEVFRAAFDSDWASTTGGLFVAQQEPPSVFGISPKQLTAGKVLAIKAALVPCYPELWSVFQTFCCHLSTTSKVIVFGINKFGYGQMTEDGDLYGMMDDETNDSDAEDSDGGGQTSDEEESDSDEDNEEERQELDLLWTSVTCAALSKKQAKESNNHAERLIRWEFIEWIVRASIARRTKKIVKGGRIVKKPPDDVAAAVSEFCAKFLGNLAKTSAARDLTVGFMLVDDAISYRNEHCYHEKCDAVLRENKTSLHNIFTAYSKGDGNLSNKVIDSEKKLSLMEWGRLMQDLGFLEEISERYTVDCFIRARMVIVGELSEAARGQQNTLTFEDFMDALTRVALLMPLPSDAEISAANHRLAGDYLFALGPSKYQHWLDAQRQLKVPYVDGDPSHRRLRRLIELIIYIIEHGIEAKGAKGVKMTLGKGLSADGALTTEEIALFKRHPKPFNFEGVDETELELDLAEGDVGKKS